MEPPLEIDRVEWLSASTQAVLVRVLGHWRGPVSEAEPVLLVDDGHTRRPFNPISEDPAGLGPLSDPGVWVARFSVPIELRPRLEHGLALKLGASELALPGAVAGGAPGDGPAVAGEVIDRAVLSERRARRAEVNEQALARRIAEADARVTTLESQLSNLEQRLEQTTRERERMAHEISEREGDVRRVKQREYAEQQLRVEAEERRDRSERRARTQLEELHRRLAETEREGVALAEELELARREVAEAQHAAAAERASVRRARAELAEREVEMTRREAALAEAEQSVSDGLAAASAAESDLAALSHELETQRATLGARLGTLESTATALQGELEREQAGRRRAEQELTTARARLAAGAGAQPAAAPVASAVDGAEEVARLEAELERRTRLHDQVQAELAALHEELERLRESAVEQTERDRAAERLLAGLTDTVGGLRAELNSLEQRQHELEGEAERLRRELADREDEILRVGAGTGRDAAELARLREQTSRHAEQRSEREAELERMVRELMGTASELREGFERELGSLNAEMQERVLAERDTYLRELTTMEQRVDSLRRDLLDTAASLRTELEAERASRRRAEAELASARERVAAEPPTLSEAPAAPAGMEAGEAHPDGERERETADRGPQGTAGGAAADPRPEGEAEPEPPNARSETEAEPEAAAARTELEAAPEAADPRAEPAGEPESEPDTADPGSAPEAATPRAERATGPGGGMSEALTEASMRLRARVEATGEEGLGKPGAQPSPEATLAHDVPSSPDDGAPAAREGGLVPPPGTRAEAPADDAGATDDGSSPPTAASVARGDAIPPDARPIAAAAFSVASPDPSPAWLAGAIRGVAAHRAPALAVELVLELLPAQGLVIDRPFTYDLTLTEAGDFRVSLPGDGPARVTRLDAHSSPAEADARPEFLLEGPPAAFSALVGGGAGRRMKGIQVRGPRRKARKLLRARRPAVALADMAQAGIRVWPGLLLLAIAEEIDPRWTSGHSFVLRYSILSTPAASVYVQVRDGQPVVVTGGLREARPVATVYVTERSFLCLLAGVAPPAGEDALMTGDTEALKLFTSWSDRVQGLTGQD